MIRNKVLLYVEVCLSHEIVMSHISITSFGFSIFSSECVISVGLEVFLDRMRIMEHQSTQPILPECQEDHPVDLALLLPENWLIFLLVSSEII